MTASDGGGSVFGGVAGGVAGGVVTMLADLAHPAHQRDIVALTEAYACDPMGNGRSLGPEVLAELIPGLRHHPSTLVFLAYADSKAVGIATCFLGFSTFAAKPLINIHDLAVLPGHRGQGIGKRLLAAVEQAGRERGCVKLTLEVNVNNTRAKHTYESFGFRHTGADTPAGGQLFFFKPLAP